MGGNGSDFLCAIFFICLSGLSSTPTVANVKVEKTENFIDMPNVESSFLIFH